MHHLTCGISSILHSVNLILFTVLLVHLILCISPHHSHHLHSHHPSLPLPFTPDLKFISFTNPFLYSHSYNVSSPRLSNSTCLFTENPRSTLSFPCDKRRSIFTHDQSWCTDKCADAFNIRSNAACVSTLSGGDTTGSTCIAAVWA